MRDTLIVLWCLGTAFFTWFSSYIPPETGLVVFINFGLVISYLALALFCVHSFIEDKM